jgi:DUF1680 family protein
LDGTVKFTLALENAERFALSFRIPAWCHTATVTVGGEQRSVTAGYATVEKDWQEGDTVELVLAMPVERILPPVGAVNEEFFAAYRRGPMILAADARLVDPHSVIDVAVDENGLTDGKLVYCPEIREALLCIELEKADGKSVRLVNYSSAGKTWTKESECAAWMYRVLPPVTEA